MRKYSSISVETTLASSIGATGTTITVATGTGSGLLGGVTLAAGNVDQFTLAIDPDTANEEIVFATANSGDSFTIIRARAGTSGITHGSGATVKHVLTSDDLTYFNATLPATLVEAKGDLVAGSAANAADNLTVGADGTVLTADSAQSLGIKWASAFPSQTNNAGKFLKTNGTSVSWGDISTLAINNQSGTTYTFVYGDSAKLVTFSSSSAVTVTVPTNASVGFDLGTQINVAQLGTGQVTLVGDTGVTINATPGLNIRAQFAGATLVKTNTDTWLLLGDLSA